MQAAKASTGISPPPKTKPTTSQVAAGATDPDKVLPGVKGAPSQGVVDAGLPAVQAPQQVMPTRATGNGTETQMQGVPVAGTAAAVTNPGVAPGGATAPIPAQTPGTANTGKPTPAGVGGSSGTSGTSGTGNGGGETSAQAEATAVGNLNSDIDAGKAYTNASGAFANGAMGRVNATTDAATADALAKAKGLEQGLSAPQMQAEKELNDQAIGGQLQSNLMQLRGIQGAQGLRGGSAAAQQMQLGYNALGQQQQAVRQESLDQLAAQQAGVQNFLSDNQSNNAFNTGNMQYNNQQANAEAAGRLSTPLTYAGLLQGARSAGDATNIAQEGVVTAGDTAAATAKQAAAAQDWLTDPRNPANQAPSGSTPT